MLTMFNQNAWEFYMQFEYINLDFQSKYFVYVMVVLVWLKNVDLKKKNWVMVKNLTLKSFSLCIVHMRFICKLIIWYGSKCNLWFEVKKLNNQDKYAAFRCSFDAAVTFEELNWWHRSPVILILQLTDTLHLPLCQGSACFTPLILRKLFRDGS